MSVESTVCSAPNAPKSQSACRAGAARRGVAGGCRSVFFFFIKLWGWRGDKNLTRTSQLWMWWVFLVI